MKERLFLEDRSVMVALDVAEIGNAVAVVRGVRGVPKISSFKIGYELGYEGLAAAVGEVRRAYGAPTRIVFDHQKAGTDLPRFGTRFAAKMKRAEVDAAILFPFAGPATLDAWVKALQDAEVHVLVGLVMTHEKFLVHEGGYIDNAAIRRAFDQACELGVRDFVAPGTRIGWIDTIRSIVEEHWAEGWYSISAPGLVTQGGDVSAAGIAAGPRFCAIVGEAIYGQPTMQDVRNAALMVTGKL